MFVHFNCLLRFTLVLFDSFPLYSFIYSSYRHSLSFFVYSYIRRTQSVPIFCDPLSHTPFILLSYYFLSIRYVNLICATVLLFILPRFRTFSHIYLIHALHLVYIIYFTYILHIFRILYIRLMIYFNIYSGSFNIY